MSMPSDGIIGTLSARRGFWDDRAARRSHAALLRMVLETDLEASAPPPLCRPFAFFDGAGRCVAALEAFPLDLLLDGQPTSVAAIRSVAVDPDWRGQGLFRRLMTDALAWTEDTIPGPALLYTAEPALYHRFGFRDCAQHKIVGPPPPPAADATAARRLRRGTLADDAVLDRLLATRVPVSTHVGVIDGRALLLAHLAQQEAEIALDHIPGCDALILSCIEEDHDDASVFTLIDVIAATIPPLATIVRSLGRTPTSVAVHFPTDRLGWSGQPQEEDTGLMIRGVAPEAFTRPFMLPPTAGF